MHVAAAAAAYFGDGIFHTVPGVAVAGAATQQLRQLPVLVARSHAHAGVVPCLDLYPCLHLTPHMYTAAAVLFCCCYSVLLRLGSCLLIPSPRPALLCPPLSLGAPGLALLLQVDL